MKLVMIVLGTSPPRQQLSKPKLITRRKAKGKLIEKHKARSGIPRMLQPYLALWRKYGGNKHLDENTKSFRYGLQSLKLLAEGKAFDQYFPQWKGRRFTEEEFESSLISFDQAKKDDPTLKSYPLNIFILNNFTKRKRSLFLEYLIKGPEKDQILTRLLISYYKDNILGGMDPKPSKSDRDKFILASNRLGDFFKQCRGKISPAIRVDRPKMVRWLFEAVQQSLNGFKDASITPGHLCSDLTFHDRLPKFLVRQAIFRDRNIQI